MASDIVVPMSVFLSIATSEADLSCVEFIIRKCGLDINKANPLWRNW